LNSTGNLTNWWTANVAEKFEQKAKCVSDLYSSYEVEPGLNVNGDLTLGENIADMVRSAFVVVIVIDQRGSRED
jgi:predicted metalloendopeptidase